MTPEPSRKHIEDAQKLAYASWMPGRMGQVVVDNIAAFLAARDAEAVRPWREVPNKGESA